MHKRCSATINDKEIKRIYITNNAGTKKIKKLNIKKGKNITLNIMIPKQNYDEGKALENFGASVFSIKAAKKEFACSFSCPMESKTVYSMVWNNKDTTKLSK